MFGAEENEQYKQALLFATEKHSGQFRIGGEAYITHPAAVARYVREWGYGLEYQITALFHDLLEDTDATEEQIQELGGSQVLEAVRVLTKREGYIMSAYVAGIQKNEIAKVVKAADRLHNLRSAAVTDEQFKRRYIFETLDWYMDFSPEIPKAVRELSKTLKEPMQICSSI